MNKLTAFVKFLIRVLIIIGVFALSAILIFGNSTPYWFFMITLPFEVVFVYMSYSVMEKEIK